MEKKLSDAWEQDDKLTVFGYGKKAAADEIFKVLTDGNEFRHDVDIAKEKKKFGVD